MAREVLGYGEDAARLEPLGVGQCSTLDLFHSAAEATRANDRIVRITVDV